MREHHHLRILLVRAGSVILDENAHARAGDVIIVAPGGACLLEPEESTTVTVVDVDADLVLDLVRWRYGRILLARSDAADFLTSRYRTPVSLIRLSPEWIRLASPWVDELETLTEERAFVDRFYRLVAGLSALLDVLVPHLAPTPTPRPPQTRAHVSPAAPGGTACAPRRFCRPEAAEIDALFRRDLARRWTLDELAVVVHLSPSQVRRVMIASYGQTPLSRLNRLRAEEAARLLREQGLPLTAAYRRVGWANRGYAVRVFTRVIGVSPSEYVGHWRGLR